MKIFEEKDNKPKDSESIKKFFASQKVTVSINKELMTKSIISMVVNGGISLTFFSSEAFVALNGEIYNKMGISLERHNIREMVINESKKRKRNLIDELKEKFL